MLIKTLVIMPIVGGIVIIIIIIMVIIISSSLLFPSLIWRGWLYRLHIAWYWKHVVIRYVAQLTGHLIDLKKIVSAFPGTLFGDSVYFSVFWWSHYPSLVWYYRVNLNPMAIPLHACSGSWTWRSGEISSNALPGIPVAAGWVERWL